MRNAKGNAEVRTNLALYRSARTQADAIAEIAALFFIDAVRYGQGEKVRKMSNQFSKMHQKATAMRDKLDRELAPFGDVAEGGR